MYKKNAKMEIPLELISSEVVLLGPESVNWYGLVRKGFADAFLKEPFDLILNLSKNYFFTTSYLSSLAKATLKVGRYVRPNAPYRIMLETNQSDDSDAFVHLLEKSLQIVRLG
ncbi:MAG: hypothetical protein LBC84_00560 [Prevotellaceae bacterium]|nr:hypothetical protein [Prevotellaceae bacterium]